jgi:hypothetical protein
MNTRIASYVLLWSASSGFLLGLFIDALVVGVVALVSVVVMPSLAERMHQRWFAISAAVFLALIPVTLAVLGFLEGRLKTN